jgi:hypothetical protein
MIVVVLIAQLVPLLLFPPRAFATGSQELWLPILLVIMVVIADLYLVVRHTSSLWPWYLISFAQGFNIISRLMLLWANATNAAGTTVDVPYVLSTVVSIVLSAFLLWYTELPEVRMGLVRD